MEKQRDRSAATENLSGDLAPKEGVSDTDSRALSSQRVRYEAEVILFNKKYGSLEAVRLSLGLSRRKICQLLLVDPSAWTRWMKDQAPPHIYRALEWYLILNERFPGQKGYWINQQITSQEEAASWGKEISTLHSKIQELSLKLAEMQKTKVVAQKDRSQKKKAPKEITLKELMSQFSFRKGGRDGWI